MEAGSNMRCQFAILKWTKEGRYYAFLQANGQLHPDQGAVPLSKSTATSNLLLADGGSAGVTPSASSSKGIDGLNRKDNSRPLGASLVSQQDFTATDGISAPLEESSAAFGIETDDMDFVCNEILAAGEKYFRFPNL